MTKYSLEFEIKVVWGYLQVKSSSASRANMYHILSHRQKIYKIKNLC